MIPKPHQHITINSTGVKYKERTLVSALDEERRLADVALTAKRRRAQDILDAAEFGMSVEDFLEEGHF